MRQATTSLTRKGQVTIPVHIRRALGLKPRDRVAFTLEDGVATVRKAESVVDQLFGSVPYKGPPLDFKKLREEYEDEMVKKIWRDLGLDRS